MYQERNIEMLPPLSLKKLLLYRVIKILTLIKFMFQNNYRKKYFIKFEIEFFFHVSHIEFSPSINGYQQSDYSNIFEKDELDDIPGIFSHSRFNLLELLFSLSSFHLIITNFWLLIKNSKN